jgi:glycosyltransferase involved in cell wall biosynthesis
VRNGHVLEIIIVNDGSTEPQTKLDLRRVHREFNPIVKLYDNLNRGLSFARNFGLMKASGSHIQFLDADDLIHASKFELQLYGDFDKYDVFLCAYYTSDGNLENQTYADISVAKSFNIDNVLFAWERDYSIPIHCALFKKSIISRIPFNMALRAKEDWLFWVELALLDLRVRYTKEPLAVYRLANHNMTKDIELMARYFCVAVRRICSLLPPTLIFRFKLESSRWFDTYYVPHLSPVSAIIYKSMLDTREAPY